MWPCAATAADARGWKSPGARATPAKRSSTRPPNCSPTLGYANTSTRRIADAVGVRQASLYHHFATKDDILDACWQAPSTSRCGWPPNSSSEKGPARGRLHTLVVPTSPSCAPAGGTSARSICCPSCGWTRFEQFRLRPRRTARTVPQARRRGDRRVRRPADAADLPFRLVESVINRRSDDGDCPPSSRGSSPTARCARSDSAATSPRCGGDGQSAWLTHRRESNTRCDTVCARLLSRR